jgi:hypothetical protein
MERMEFERIVTGTSQNAEFCKPLRPTNSTNVKSIQIHTHTHMGKLHTEG